jgi:hypothetical protein
VKRFGVTAMLVCFLSLHAFATTYTFQESGGSLNLVRSLKFGQALQLMGSKIVSINGPSLHLTAGSSGKLGSLKLAGALLVSSSMTGSKQSGSITGTYAYGSGTMTLTNSLKNTPLPRGVIFNGTFNSETLTVTYTYGQKLNAKGKPFYFLSGRSWQLIGNVVGKMYNGQRLTGTFDISRAGGRTAGIASLSAVPEPGTLLLLATGLLSIAGLVRSRIHSPDRS